MFGPFQPTDAMELSSRQIGNRGRAPANQAFPGFAQSPPRSTRKLRLRKLAQAPDAIFDAFAPDMPGAQSQAIANAPARGEHVAGRKADALLERFLEELA